MKKANLRIEGKSKLLLMSLIGLFLLSHQTIEIAYAKNPINCGVVQIAQNGTPNPVLCPNGSPNSNAKKILTSLNPKVMKLKKTSSNSEIIQTICSDQENSSNQIIFNAYQYQYSFFDWAGKRLDPSTMLNNLITDDNFCLTSKQSSPSNSSQSQSVSNILVRLKSNSNFEWVEDPSSLIGPNAKYQKFIKAAYLASECGVFVLSDEHSADPLFDSWTGKDYWVVKDSMSGYFVRIQTSTGKNSHLRKCVVAAGKTFNYNLTP